MVLGPTQRGAAPSGTRLFDADVGDVGPVGEPKGWDMELPQ